LGAFLNVKAKKKTTMIKAHSLLYSIFICLVVALLCGAMIYVANLYNQLNLYYTSHTQLYAHNQSLVNFATAHISTPLILPDENEESGIESQYQIKQYGLLPVVIAKSIIKSDTVTSAHFAGLNKHDKTGVYLTNLSVPLSYSGIVKIFGEKKLPSTYIRGTYINNMSNALDVSGPVSISEKFLPLLPDNKIEKITAITGKKVLLQDLPIKKSLYYNSFKNEPLEINPGNIISNINIKGNIIIRSNDSIIISKTAVLEDVIVIAPKIIIESDFKGSLQAYATYKLCVAEGVTLNYPSVLCILNKSDNESEMNLGKHILFAGAMLLNGNSFRDIDKNRIEISEDSTLICDIYCSGTLSLKSNIYGSVYTNKFRYKTLSSSYDNCLANVVIDPLKRPSHIFSLPIFNGDNHYGAFKKVI
jgi:hypothetical protein